jgi:hypothetical protein
MNAFGPFKPSRRIKGVPLTKWDSTILSWTAGYWFGKWKSAKHWKEKARWKRWHDQAQAELFARKLAGEL